MHDFAIRVPRGFRFAATVEAHGWYQLAPFAWDGSTLRRAEAIDAARAIDVTITFEDALVVRVRARRDEPLLRSRARRMFQLDVDLKDFHRLCRATSSHAAVARAGFGRLLCGSTLFEDAVKIIATTNTTWQQTKRMVRGVVDLCGPRTPSGRAAFPTPESVASVTAAELKEVCRMGYRAESVRRLADAIRGFEATLDLALPSAELFERYRTLPGIGPYGAAHLLAMDGRHDYIAVDSEFRRFVRERYHGGRKVADRALLRRYATWGPWKYLAYWSEMVGT